jgi:hypothetical protein
MYADLDFWLALLKNDDWLAGRAESVLDEHEGDLEVSLATFIELFLIEEREVGPADLEKRGGEAATRFAFDRERAVTAILELATYDGDPNVVYQASENIDEGLHTFDAFHAALSGGGIISSDRAYDDLTSVSRTRLEPDANGGSAAEGGE